MGGHGWALVCVLVAWHRYAWAEKAWTEEAQAEEVLADEAWAKDPRVVAHMG